MSFCRQCGAQLRKAAQFCSSCGADTGNAGSAATASRVPPRNAQPASTTQTTSINQTAAATADQTGDSKSIAWKAGVSALTKSLALSAAVLGPGFLMLMNGAIIPGMIWLFVGSFGLMAWTYRKPWRLSFISCLVPPAVAGLCYLLQLALFGDAMPPAIMLLVAIGLGLAVGYARGQTHNVYQDESGGVIAQRTIAYLGIWVACYGLTQLLAFTAREILLVQGGLLSGAFSTAMLAMVSVTLYWRRAEFTKSASAFSVPATASILLLATVVSSEVAQAGSGNMGQAASSALKVGVEAYLPLQAPCSLQLTDQNNGNDSARITYKCRVDNDTGYMIEAWAEVMPNARASFERERERRSQQVYSSSQTRSYEMANASIGNAGYVFKDTYRGLTTTYDTDAVGYMGNWRIRVRLYITLPPGQPQPGSIEQITTGIAADIARRLPGSGSGDSLSSQSPPSLTSPHLSSELDDLFGRLEENAQEGLRLEKERMAIVEQCKEGVNECLGLSSYCMRHKCLSEYSALKTCAENLSGLGQQTFDASLQCEQEKTQHRGQSEGNDLGGLLPPSYDPSTITAPSDSSTDTGLLPPSYDPSKITAPTDNDSGPGLLPPSYDPSTITAPSDSSTDTGLLPPSYDPSEIGSWSPFAESDPEAAAAAVALISLIMIAGGIAANVAQAMATAMAGAVQATAEATAQEVSEALQRQRAADSAKATAPPIIDPKDGTPFQTNEDGQYWAPDETGRWRWLSENEARQAAAALQGEVSARNAERGAFEAETQGALSQSRDKMAAADAKLRAQEAREKARSTWWNEQGAKGTQSFDQFEGARQQKELEAAAAQRDADAGISPEQRQRINQLKDAIWNATEALPEEEAAPFKNQFADAANADNQEELEKLWEQMRSLRVQQIVDAERAAADLHEKAIQAQRAETAISFARDSSKAMLGAGLSTATGGGASMLQAASTIAVGTGGLTTIGGIEQGYVTDNGKVEFDPWKATKGAVRGATDAVSSLVGGLNANGNLATAGGKAVFSGVTTGARTTADTLSSTGNWELAKSRGMMAGGADLFKTALGEAFDAQSGRVDKHAEAMKLNRPPDVAQDTWEQMVDAKHAASKTRVAAGKLAGDLVGGTLTEIASSDEDISTGQAVANTIWSEVKGKAAGKVVGSVKSAPDIDTDARRAVIDRLQSERMGHVPLSEPTKSYSDYLARQGKSRDDYVPSHEPVANEGGFHPEARKHFQRVADQHGVKITVRPVDPEGAALHRDGLAVAKRESMKANTGKPIDVLLGMKPEHNAKVVVFDPVLPDRDSTLGPDGKPLTDAQWKSLESRYQVRKEQYDLYEEKLQDHEEYKKDGQLVIDKKENLPIVGDGDMFSVTGLHNEPVPKAVSDQAVRDLKRASGVMGQDIKSMVEHGEHLAWDISALDNEKVGADGLTEYQRAVGINERILSKISPEHPEREALATFTGRPGLTEPIVEGSYYQGSGPRT